MIDKTLPYDGMVVYTDGSQRRQRTGWGLHVYLYKNEPLTRGIGTKHLPSVEGYTATDLKETVTPLCYFDAFGRLPSEWSNNVAELVAAMEGIQLASQYQIEKLFIRCDSEYVRLGITRWIKKWKKNGWLSVDGEPIKNIDQWKRLDQLVNDYKDAGRHLEFKWVKAHKGEPGNERADLNAKTGGSSAETHYLVELPVENYHAAKGTNNPLNFKKRMLFNIGADEPTEEQSKRYYLYHLGRAHQYAHKKEDTLTARHRKTDLLLGKRMSDALFSIMRLDKPDEYLELIKDLHATHHAREVIELGVACLDIAYRPSIQQRLQQHGHNAMVVVDNNFSIITPQDDLISITLDPPRLAKEAIDVFQIMDSILTSHLEGREQKGVFKQDVTEHFYSKTVKDKPTPTTVYKLLPHITNNLPSLEIPVTYQGQTFNLKVLLGTDILARNNLAKCADVSPVVTLYMSANGPESSSFGFIIDTTIGTAIYQSPYTQFLLPSPISK